MNYINIILVFSIIINIFLVWYIIQLLKRFLDFQSYLDEFVEKLEEYEGHIDIVYNLETFYGDATLSNLLKHSKEISQECKSFKILYFGDEEEEEQEEENDDDNEKDTKYGI
jgi:hypothetical protein